MKKFLLLSLLTLSLVGCSTYRLCDQGGHLTVDIENTGWYLFQVIPIAAGNPDAPNVADCRWFSDTVTLENNMKLLDEAVESTDAHGAVNITSSISEENILFVLFSHKIYHTSAELLK